MRPRSDSTLAGKIHQYVIDHPHCLKSEIMRDLGVTQNTISGTLSRLRAAGLIRHIKDVVVVDGKRYPVTRWENGPEPDFVAKERVEGLPKRKIVKDWTPREHMESNPLFALFFNNHNKEETQDEQAFAS